jgi:cytochrome c oxidase subunit 4
MSTSISEKPTRAVLVTGAALLALWAASFALSYVSLGGWALPVAIAIAVVKAVLVALVFMELLHESLSIKLTILAALALLLTLIGLMVADIATRAPPPLDAARRPPSGV